jgi:hypothetical protein
MRNLVVVFLLLFGCGGSGGVSTHDLAVSNIPPDFSVQQQTQPDLSQPDVDGGSGTGTCGDIITCVDGATTQTAFNACVAAGSTAGQAQFNALNNCLNTTCPSTLPASGGTGSCGNQMTCPYCAQSGTSSDNMTNGTCSNLAAGGGPTITDPTCGKCVDQLLGCMN